MWSVIVLQLGAFAAVVVGAFAGLERGDDSGWIVFAAWLLIGAALYGFGSLVEDVRILRERLAPLPGEQQK
jgi:hypothetical protein